MRKKELFSKFKQEDVDALLITNETNASYITNYPSHDSWLLITPAKQIYITDFRYFQEVKRELRGFTIYKTSGSIFSAVAMLAQRLRLKRVFFEAKHLPFAEFKKLKQLLKERNIQFLPSYDLIESVRSIKAEYEIEKMRKAIALTADAFDFLGQRLKAGVRESDVAIELEYYIRRRGATFAFDPIIASGARSAFPHARISDKPIADNTAVTVDIGLSLEGYKSDLTRVFFLGRIPLALKKIYAVVCEAQQEAIRRIRPGVRASEIDEAARNIIRRNGLGAYFGHALGHGVGLEVHEFPSVSSKSDTILQEGMVFTVEPAVYIPGRYGVRVEDMIIVTQQGCEVLSVAVNKSG